MATLPGIPVVTLDSDWPDPVADDGSVVFARWSDLTFARPPSGLTARHAFHEFLLIERGRAWHAVDGDTIELGPRTLSLVASGQVFTCVSTDAVTGWRLRFTDAFLPDDSQAVPVFARPGRSLVLSLGADDLRALGAIADLIEAECARPTAADRAAALRHLLALLLVHAGRLVRTAADTDEVERDDQRAFHAFTMLLERDFAAHHDVRHYAETIGLPPARLSGLIGRVLGVPTKRAIDERLVLEAKRLLRHSAMPLGEIADQLGYRDPFHLSKTFKRLTGTSPRAYRQLKKVT